MIMSARLPIIKLVDCGTGIECDLSIENRDGIVKSQIVYIISRIDGRFQKLSFMISTVQLAGRRYTTNLGFTSESSATEHGGDLNEAVNAHFREGDVHRDTGIGMKKEELIDCLGTIAQSGTSKFLTALKDLGADNGLDDCLEEGHCVSIRGKFGPVRKPRASTREG